MGSKNFPGGVAERGWKPASQSKLYHKVELDALCHNILKKFGPNELASPANMGSKNLPGGVAERDSRQASQSKLYHKVELDPLCQNMLKIRPQGTCSPADMGSKTFPEGWPSGVGSERAKENCTIR